MAKRKKAAPKPARKRPTAKIEDCHIEPTSDPFLSMCENVKDQPPRERLKVVAIDGKRIDAIADLAAAVNKLASALTTAPVVNIVGNRFEGTGTTEAPLLWVGGGSSSKDAERCIG